MLFPDFQARHMRPLASLCAGVMLAAALSTVASARQTGTGSPPSTGTKPGRDRWPVKTASDPDAREVRRTPVKTTIEKLNRLPRPADLPLDRANPAYQERRARPVETTVYTVEAEVTECRLMPDGDYRVVLRGASGETLTLEMPNPAPQYVSAQSPFVTQIKTARQQIEKKAHPTVAMKPMTLHAFARITGIGYWGRAYRAEPGDKGNHIQLHPVLAVQWLPKAGGARQATPAGRNRKTL